MLQFSPSVPWAVAFIAGTIGGLLMGQWRSEYFAAYWYLGFCIWLLGGGLALVIAHATVPVP